jgi:tryptophan synthase alpha chain
MSRIEATFEKLKLHGRKALIPFITAGDPNPQLTVPLMHVSLHHVLGMVEQFRNNDVTTPVVLMGYGNPVEVMGWEHFAKRCAEVGVDGVLTVDFPPEESHEAFGHLQRHGIDPIFLLAPTTRDERVEKVAKLARGYVYYVSLKGVTGAGNLDLSEVEKKIPQLRKHISLPIGVGFGIRDAATAHAVSRLCDGVVVGSRIVQEIENSDEQHVVAKVATLVKELRLAIDQ